MQNIFAGAARKKPAKCVFAGVRAEALGKGAYFTTIPAHWDDAVRMCIFQGYSTFCSGMTKGLPLLAAEHILALRAEYPHIELHCYLPCETQANNWQEYWRERYFNVLAQADKVLLLQSSYTPGCLQAQQRAMLQGASRLLALYPEEALARRPYAVRYAEALGLDIVVIDPLGSPKKLGMTAQKR